MLRKVQSRSDLAILFGELGFKYGAEIGVRRGTFSANLCHTMPGLKLLCVDPWLRTGMQKQQDVDEFLKQAQKVLEGFDIVFMRMKSEKASEGVEDGTLDFVYIDAAHDYDNVKLDLECWVPKVRVGGVVAGHDYIRKPSHGGVTQAVKFYTEKYKIQGLSTTTTDYPASFYWVKEGEGGR